MIHPILMILLLIVVGISAYYAGKQDNKKGRQKLYNDLVTERAVRHNLNCLVGDLRHDNGKLANEVTKYKPDAQAYHTVVGLWATDLPRLIKYNKEKELFFRIGYPEHKL